MTRVANTAGLYNTFNQNFDDPNGYITKLPAETIDHMNRMPPFITEWQAKDIINDDVGDYYQNPMASITFEVRGVAKSIVYSSTNVTNLVTMNTKAQELSDMANTFFAHTNRLSGVTKFDGMGDPADPYLDIAMGYGKTVAYIVYQTDGIDDTSPMMNSFTSLLIKPQIMANNEILKVYAANVANSIVATEVTLYDEYNMPYTQTTYTSNLTSQSINTVISKMDDLKNLMYTRQQADRNYFHNMSIFISRYNETKKFNSMGNTENNLVRNMIGTPKLLDRLNS